jgi:hypothetical protein
MVEVGILGALWEHLASSLEMALEAREVAVAKLLTRLGIETPAEVGIVTVDGRQGNLDEIVPWGQPRVHLSAHIWRVV